MNTALFIIVMQTLVPGALVLTEDTTDVSGIVAHWAAPAGSETTPEEALLAFQKGNFTEPDGKVPNLGFAKGPAWFAVSIRAGQTNQEYIANIGYPVLDSIEFWVVIENQLTQFQHAGDLEPFDARARSHRTINFSMALKANQKATLLLKVETKSSVNMALTLLKPEAFTEKVAEENLMQGIYCGVLLVMIFFNGFLFGTLRDKNYLLYICYLSAFLMFQTSITGVLYQHFLSDFPWLNEKALILGGLFSAACICLFTLSFLEMHENNPKLTKAMDRLGKTFLVLGLFGMVLPYRLMSQLLVIAALASCTLCFFTTLLRLKQGYRPARIFLLAWGAFIVGGVLFALRAAGILPSNTITENSVQIGSALEAILLTLALGDRMNLVQQERDSANRHALESYRLLGEEVSKRDQLSRNNRALAMEIQLATEQLVQADKLATLGQLVAGVAHDIANPTSYIHTSQEILRTEVQEIENILELIFRDNNSPEAKKVRDKLGTHLTSIQRGLGDIKDGSAKITQIHQAIRNQSRVDQEPQTGVELLTVVHEAITMVRTKLQLIEVDIREHKVPSITCRRSQIGQILMNLIGNAADAIHEIQEKEREQNKKPTKGIIQMTLLQVPQDGIDGVAIRIEDNGPGIPEEKREQVRETFFTTKAVGVGTGLGLSICEKIIEAHQGKLIIDDSVEFGGASMLVWLPTYVEIQGQESSKADFQGANS